MSNREVVYTGSLGKGNWQFEVTQFEKKEANQYGKYGYTFKVFNGTYNFKGKETKDYGIPSWQADDAIATIELAKAKCAELEASQTTGAVTAAAKASTTDSPPV